MTPFQLITDAVSPLKAYADHNPKKESEYVVFNIADDRGTVHGDDQPTQRVMAVQVHYYAPHGTNYLTTMTNIRNRACSEGVYLSRRAGPLRNRHKLAPFDF